MVSPDNSPNLILTINGNFFDIGNQGYDAIVKIRNHSYSNFTKSTNLITFNIPKSEFVAVPNQVIYRQFSINIPYKKTVALVLKKKVSTDFLLNFIVLPLNAGTFNLYTTKMIDTIITQSATCNNLIWDSSQDDIEAIHGCTVADGWVCDINSVKIAFFSRKEGQEGKDWYDLGNASNLTAAQWHCKTLHKGTGTSGKLTLTLSFLEHKTIKAPHTDSSGNTSLKWGESKVLTFDPTATWKLVYQEFDGKEIDFSSSNSSNSYFKVITIGNQIQINTVP